MTRDLSSHPSSTAAHGASLCGVANGPFPPALVSDLRTDHAGETGAVMIYRGILAVTRGPALRRFAKDHLAIEANHLAVTEPLLAICSAGRADPCACSAERRGNDATRACHQAQPPAQAQPRL